MQASETVAAAAGHNNSIGHDGGIARKHLTIGLVAALLLAVWTYARFGEDVAQPVPPAPSVGAFAMPEAFVATPGLNYIHIHVRSGPGGEYRATETLDRGASLTGIARTTDSKGAFWIELAKSRGFVKETVVTRVDGTPNQ